MPKPRSREGGETPPFPEQTAKVSSQPWQHTNTHTHTYTNSLVVAVRDEGYDPFRFD